MEIDERIALVKSLIAKREEIDTQLVTLFGGQLVSRRQQKCKKCSAVGHRSDACPTTDTQRAEPL